MDLDLSELDKLKKVSKGPTFKPTVRGRGNVSLLSRLDAARPSSAQGKAPTAAAAAAAPAPAPVASVTESAASALQPLPASKAALARATMHAADAKQLPVMTAVSACSALPMLPTDLTEPHSKAATGAVHASLEQHEATIQSQQHAGMATTRPHQNQLALITSAAHRNGSQDHGPLSGASTGHTDPAPRRLGSVWDVDHLKLQSKQRRFMPSASRLAYASSQPVHASPADEPAASVQLATPEIPPPDMASMEPSAPVAAAAAAAAPALHDTQQPATPAAMHAAAHPDSANPEAGELQYVKSAHKRQRKLVPHVSQLPGEDHRQLADQGAAADQGTAPAAADDAAAAETSAQAAAGPSAPAAGSHKCRLAPDVADATPGGDEQGPQRAGPRRRTKADLLAARAKGELPRPRAGTRFGKGSKAAAAAAAKVEEEEKGQKPAGTGTKTEVAIAVEPALPATAAAAAKGKQRPRQKKPGRKLMAMAAAAAAAAAEESEQDEPGKRGWLHLLNVARLTLEREESLSSQAGASDQAGDDEAQTEDDSAAVTKPARRRTTSSGAKSRSKSTQPQCKLRRPKAVRNKSAAAEAADAAEEEAVEAAVSDAVSADEETEGATKEDGAAEAGRKRRCSSSSTTGKKRGRPPKVHRSADELALVQVERDKKAHAKRIRAKVSEALQLAGLVPPKLPAVRPEEPMDLENWPLRKIIAHTQAWDRQKRQEGKVRAAELAIQQAKEREEAEEAAGPSTLAAAGAIVPRDEPRAVGPRLQVVDGQIVIDATSLTVHAQRTEVQTYTRVEESHRTLNSFSYMNRLPSDRWTPEETEMFYRAVRHFGTDFMLIAQLFPSRDRKHIKNKFNKEQRVAPNKLNDALRGGSASNAEDRNALIEIIKNNISAAAASEKDEEPLPLPAAAEGEGEGTQQAQQEEEDQQDDAAGTPTTAATAVAAAKAAAASSRQTFTSGLEDGSIAAASNNSLGRFDVSPANKHRRMAPTASRRPVQAAAGTAGHTGLQDVATTSTNPAPAEQSAVQQEQDTYVGEGYEHWNDEGYY